MSQRPSHRRGEDRHQDNGPTFESHTPNAGCNSTHVARSRKWWKRQVSRKERRTGGAMSTLSALLLARKPMLGGQAEDEASVDGEQEA